MGAGGLPSLNQHGSRRILRAARPLWLYGIHVESWRPALLRLFPPRVTPGQSRSNTSWGGGGKAEPEVPRSASWEITWLRESGRRGRAPHPKVLGRRHVVPPCSAPSPTEGPQTSSAHAPPPSPRRLSFPSPPPSRPAPPFGAAPEMVVLRCAAAASGPAPLPGLKQTEGNWGVGGWAAGRARRAGGGVGGGQEGRRAGRGSGAGPGLAWPTSVSPGRALPGQAAAAAAIAPAPVCLLSPGPPRPWLSTATTWEGRPASQAAPEGRPSPPPAPGPLAPPLSFALGSTWSGRAGHRTKGVPLSIGRRPDSQGRAF